MADCRITCVTRTNQLGGYGHITEAGNPPTWLWSKERIIRSIEDKSNTFYVLDALGRRADVGVVYPVDGRDPYIRTYADGVWTDNLLAMDTCAV